MPRKPRNFQIGHSYHITTRCNNREFKLSRRECREVFLYAIKKVSTKYNFRLYALCIMSNHVHYLIEPLQPEDRRRPGRGCQVTRNKKGNKEKM